MTKIGVVGCGNLGSSIIEGIQKANIAKQIIGSRRNASKINIGLKEMPNVQIISDNSFLLEQSELIIIALKPYNVIPFIEENKDKLEPQKHILVSAATGISIREMQQALGSDFAICRAMPNTAATIGESMTLLSYANCNQAQKEQIEKVFRSIGDTIEIDENLMDAATVLGACGIAYVLRFMRAMIQGGIEVGFDSNTATKIVAQTMIGAAELVQKNGTHPEQEIDKVTTPKGCTIVGLNEMEHAGFSSALIRGIVASYNKISD